MTERSAKNVVVQAVSDFDGIRDAIRGHRVEVPYPTKTSKYAELIANIRIGSLSGTHKHFGTVELVNSVLGTGISFYEGSHSPLNVLCGTAQAIDD